MNVRIFLVVFLIASTLACETTSSNPEAAAPNAASPPMTPQPTDSGWPPGQYFNLIYGPDVSNKLDIYLPDTGGKKTPLVLWIHGGGFVAGDKNLSDEFLDPESLLNLLLNKGYAVASLNYRFSTGHAFQPGSGLVYPVPMRDCALALQWLRNLANQFNIDPDRVVSMGESAGADISYWLALHDDLKDPANVDLTYRMSTRILGAAGKNLQGTLDPGGDGVGVPGWIDLIGWVSERAVNFFGLTVSDVKGYTPYDPLKPDAAYYPYFAEASDDQHVTADDPSSYYVYYTMGVSDFDNLHNPLLSQTLRTSLAGLGKSVEYHDTDTNPELLTGDTSIVVPQMAAWAATILGEPK
jgi:acetyl esterase/lipase